MNWPQASSALLPHQEVFEQMGIDNLLPRREAALSARHPASRGQCGNQREKPHGAQKMKFIHEPPIPLRHADAARTQRRSREGRTT